MYKVKVFDFGTVSKLEEEVNNFLKSMGVKESFELIDIKFNSYAYGENYTDYHSALIIYNV